MSTSDLEKKLNQILELTNDCLGILGSTRVPKKDVTRVLKGDRVVSKPPNNFNMPLRPFIKKHVKGLSGPKKFVLLVSWLTKGDTQKQVSLEEVKENWNKMTSKSLMGIKFNRFFSAQARDNDWVESKKKGIYNLRPSWNKCFKA